MWPLGRHRKWQSAPRHKFRQQHTLPARPCLVHPARIIAGPPKVAHTTHRNRAGKYTVDGMDAWRALQIGSPGRHALPPKLVLHIESYCRWVLPDRRVLTGNRRAHCSSHGPRTETLWFTIAPPTDEDLQLITIGKDQGHADQPEHGSYSWYE
ncbi:hypothetical protein PENSPDRAFT_738649, partial [Peniophora sp. CONT]